MRFGSLPARRATVGHGCPASIIAPDKAFEELAERPGKIIKQLNKREKAFAAAHIKTLYQASGYGLVMVQIQGKTNAKPSRTLMGETPIIVLATAVQKSAVQEIR